MTPSLRRSWARFVRLALGIVVATFLFSELAHAQSAAKARPGQAKSALTKKTARAVPSSWVPNPAVTAKDAYLIVDAASGRELASDQPDELRHPASLTKLMTLYLTFAALDSGRLSLGDGLAVSLNALNASPTKMGLTGGMV